MLIRQFNYNYKLFNKPYYCFIKADYRFKYSILFKRLA